MGRPPLARLAQATADQGRERLTLECVYRAHFKATWRLLRRLGVPAAQLDDATQDVFLVVHGKLAEFDGGIPVKGWICAIAVRVASDHRRRASKRRAQELDDEIADGAPGPARQTELQQDVRLLHELLAELNDKKRTVFVLSELEQLSVPEIAHVLGVNLNTVYSRLRSARQRFEAALLRRRAATGERR